MAHGIGYRLVCTIRTCIVINPVTATKELSCVATLALEYGYPSDEEIEEVKSQDDGYYCLNKIVQEK
jgi:hypothetical protein